MSLTQPACGFCGTVANVQHLQHGLVACRGCYGKAREFLAQIEAASDRKTEYMQKQMRAILESQVEMEALAIKPSWIAPWEEREAYIDKTLAARSRAMQAEIEKDMMGNWQSTEQPMEYRSLTAATSASLDPGATTYETLVRAAAAMGLKPGAFTTQPFSIQPPTPSPLITEPEPEARQDFTRPIEFEE